MKYAVACALLLFALATPAFANDEISTECANCPAPRVYDSQEVIKTTRDVDRSRVINTTSVVPVTREVRETNHLVVRQNQIRNVGVVRHNHTIIEKEIRLVRRGHRAPPPATIINFVTHDYRTVQRPATYQDYPTAPRYISPLRVRG